MNLNQAPALRSSPFKLSWRRTHLWKRTWTRLLRTCVYSARPPRGDFRGVGVGVAVADAVSRVVVQARGVVRPRAVVGVDGGSEGGFEVVDSLVEDVWGALEAVGGEGDESGASRGLVADGGLGSNRVQNG